MTAPLGGTYTEVCGAREKHESFEGLHRKLGTVAGESGSYWKLTAGVLEIACNLLADNPWTLLLLPLFAAIPAVTLASVIREKGFAARWQRRIERVAVGHWPSECATEEMVA